MISKTKVSEPIVFKKLTGYGIQKKYKILHNNVVNMLIIKLLFFVFMILFLNKAVPFGTDRLLIFYL